MSRKVRWGPRRRKEFFGSLFEAVVAQCEGSTPLTWRGTVVDEDCAELHVFEAVTELVGGPDDGAEVLSGFVLDINALARLLTTPWEPAAVAFGCVPMQEPYSVPHVVISGVWRSVAVGVFVFAAPPPDEKASWLAYPDGSFAPKEKGKAHGQET